MRAMLQQHRLEIRKQLLGHLRRMPATLQEQEQLTLARDVPLAKGDVILHHLQIGGGESHAQSYHSGGRLSRELAIRGSRTHIRQVCVDRLCPLALIRT